MLHMLIERDRYHMEHNKDRAHYHDQEPRFKEHGTSRLREHFRQGMTLFIVIISCIICYFAFLRFDAIAKVIGKIVDILKPIIYGLVIAYLLNPIMKKVELLFEKLFRDKIKSEKVFNSLSRTTGIIASLICAVLIISALLNMLIPELYKSIMGLVNSFPDLVEDAIDRLNKLQHTDFATNEMLRNVLVQAGEALGNWVETDLLPRSNELMSNLTAGVLGVFGEVLDFVIGICAAVYLLSNKETFLAQSRKVIYALLPSKRANIVLHIFRKSNETFGGFIIGKIIDSAIIGVLCFVGVSILKIPYVVLVSVFVGVTNVIPYFGPFIGAIPCAILILLVDPLKGLYFIIFIFLLQQLDGNVIGPKILGDSTGLSAFWVLFSILLFGGLFGVLGMIIGVPTFAMIYYIIKLYISQRLEGKKLPTGTNCYDDQNYVDNEGRFVTFHQEEKGE